MSTPEILWPALRQYRHNNDNSPSLSYPDAGFVSAFDYDETVKVVTAMQEEIADLEADVAALKAERDRVQAPVLLGYVNERIVRAFPADHGGLNTCRNHHYTHALYFDPPGEATDQRDSAGEQQCPVDLTSG